MRSVLIVGGAGWRNVGDDLIADRLIRRAQRTGRPVVLAAGPAPLSWLPAGVRQVPIGGGTKGRAQLLVEVARAHEVWIGGGGLFDDRMPGFYRPFTRVARAARLLRRPYRIVAVGVGPIRRDGTAEAYRQAFQHAASATVRDEKSRERVHSTGATALPAVEPDPALWEPPALTVQIEPHDLIVNLRPWEWGELIEQRGAKVTSDIVETVAEALNALYGPTHRVGLVSMSANPGDDDSVPLDALAGRLRAQVTRFYDGDLPTIEAAVASAQVVLSMRLHLALLAVLHGAPVVGIAYDEKVAQQGDAYGFPTVALDETFTPNAVRRILSGVPSRS